MRIFLKEPTVSEKEEIVKMCEELRNSVDEIKFESASVFKDVNRVLENDNSKEL